MLTTLVNALFDEIKRQNGLTSDSALAAYLSKTTGEKVHQMAIIRWRRGELPKGLQVLGPQLIEHAEALRQNAA